MRDMETIRTQWATENHNGEEKVIRCLATIEDIVDLLVKNFAWSSKKTKNTMNRKGVHPE